MRKLLPHLKLLCQNHRFPKPSTPKIHDRPLSSAAAGDLLRSPPPFLPTELRPLSRILSNASPSWHLGLSPAGSLGFLASRFLSKYSIGIASVKPLNLAMLIESGIQSLKVSLRRRQPLDFARFSIPKLAFWTYGTPDDTVWVLIGANVFVFLLWKIIQPRYMRDHFMISLENVKSGRLHTIVTSAFSHADLEHLFTNMIGLYFFGNSIGKIFGSAFLLKLYFAGALGGSICFLLHNILTAPSSKGTFGLDYSRKPALGASAAVNAIILLNIFLFPKNIYYLNLIIPVPAALLGAFIIGSDLIRIKRGDTEISGSAHLGGALVAALAWAGLKKGWI